VSGGAFSFSPICDIINMRHIERLGDATMTIDADTMYKRYAQWNERDGVLLRLLLVLHALWGFVYLWIVVLLLIGAVILSWYGILANPLIGLTEFIWIPMLWSILKSLLGMVQGDKPPYGAVRLDAASPLARRTAEYCRQLSCTPPAGIYLVPEANAYVRSTGWYNELYIGVPLLAALDEQRFSAILAHELGHISLRHSFFSRIVYVALDYWERLSASAVYDTPLGMGFDLIARFQYRYRLKLQVMMAVLAKDHEREADHLAAQLTGSQTFAEALTLTELLTCTALARSVWNDYYRLSIAHETPPDLVPFLQETLRKVPADSLSAYESGCLRVETQDPDHHPCLRERLDALREQWPTGITFAAMDAPAADTLLSEQDSQTWHAALTVWLELPWAYEREKLQAAGEKLKTLQPGQPTGREEFRLRQLLTPHHLFLALAEARLAEDPMDPCALFFVGLEEIFCGEESGLEKLADACNQDSRYVQEALAAWGIYRQRNRLPAEPTSAMQRLYALEGSRDGYRFLRRELLVFPDVEHDARVTIHPAFVTLQDKSPLPALSRVLSEYAFVRQGWLYELSNGTPLLVLEYLPGWRPGTSPRERCRLLESARLTYLQATGKPLAIFWSKQIRNYRSIRSKAKYYGTSLK
ncbi:M48 family metalloprotease, partial [Ruminococcaceae bacterium OttesenSCG-928-L11]|nr:M48 family metalloprotease [Ruminococcaceae bacterium OttesenSCG-928-L11]